MGDYKKDIRVFGKWKAGSIWYPGKIKDIDGEKIFVHYDDGDEEWISDSKMIQKDKTEKPAKLSKYKRDERIIANWKKGNKWYAGKVKETDGERVLAHYDDGDEEWISDSKLIQKDKTVKALKLSKLIIGDKIHGNWKGGGTWYPGKITEISGDKVHVQYDDGDKEWIEDLTKLKRL